MEFQSLQRQLNAIERPSTAVKKNIEEIDGGGKEKWMAERDKKILDLKQIESKQFNLTRSLKNQSKQHATEISQLKFQLAALSNLIKQREGNQVLSPNSEFL